MLKCQSHVITTYWHHALTSTANLINTKQRFPSAGAERAFFEVQYDVNTVRLPSDGTPTHHVLTPGVPSIHTFAIDNWDDVNYRFVDVSVEGWENQTDVVGKYMSVFTIFVLNIFVKFIVSFRRVLQYLWVINLSWRFLSTTACSPLIELYAR